MSSRALVVATAALLLAVTACSAPSHDATQDASVANAATPTAQIPPLPNEPQIEAEDNRFEGESLEADEPGQASQGKVPCNAQDVALYTDLLRDVDTLALQQARQGILDPSAMAQRAMSTFQQMSPHCVDLLNKLAREQRKAFASEVPDWLKKPMLDCTCHGSVCSPCEGVNY